MSQMPSQQNEGHCLAPSWLAGWWLPLVIVLAAVSVPLARTQGQTLTWTGSVGDYSVGANWSGGIPPEGFNPIVIDNGGTAQASNSIPVSSVVISGSSTLEILPGITSQFSVSLQFFAGVLGLGTLSVGSQALVTTGDFYAGFAPGATGVVIMNGGFLSPFRTYIGFEGNATVTLENGSTLDSTTGYVGFLPGSQGLVNLSNSTWTAQEQGLPRDITVGVNGRGEIQSTSSLISALNFVMGSNAGSTGVVNVSGGTLTVQQNLQVGNAGTGTLSLANSASLSSYALSIGTLANSTGHLSLTNSSLTSSESVFVGLAGRGTLEATGAHFVAPELFIGRNSGVTGTATFSSGTLALTGEIHVGADGAGTFTLDDGGTMRTDKGNMGFAAGSNGVMNILSGTWTNTQAIFVGVSGTGTLNIGAQGAITSESGYIGQDAAGVGNVSLTGGSWNMSNTLAVGVNGTAEFSANGGEISSQWSQVGLNAGSSGVVTLSNATWTTGQTLTIGSGGDGEFFVTNGANVTAGSIELAASSGVTGLLSVINSTLTTENVIAASGTASAVFSGAQLKLLGGVSVLDTLLIDGFVPGAVVVGTGGLSVDTQGGNAQITTVLSGSGSLTKTGAGRLRLTTGNTYAGGTVVEGGVLEITNSAALGAGDVSLGTAELRARNSATLSGDLNGGIQLISVSANQTGTFSAATGQTLTIAPLDFLLVAGSTMQVGSTGNNGTVNFAPTGAVALAADTRLNVASGTLLAGNGALGFVTSIAATTSVGAGATLDFQDQLPNTVVRSLSGAGTVHIGSSGSSSLTVNSGQFSGNISGNGVLIKETSGTFVLSGQTSFVGSTTINAGTFLVEGSLSNGFGPVQVNNGGTLGGSGMVGTITLNGGTVAPGSSPGTLTAGNLFWQDGEILFELGPTQAASDLIVTGGLQGFGTTYEFSFVDRGWVESSTYTLINFVDSTIAIDAFRFTNGSGFSGAFSYNNTNTALQFTLNTVPEPTSGALAVLAGIILASRRPRRRRLPGTCAPSGSAIEYC